MGGILGGILGGMAKGVTGGLTAEGERRRKEEEFQRDLIGRMHMKRLEDWENLSPEEQEGHIKGLEAVYPEAGKKGLFRAGVGLAQALAPHINQATGQPIPEAADPLAGVATQGGLSTNARQRTPAENKLLQAELYKQTRDTEERKRRLGVISEVPNLSPEQRAHAQVEVGAGVKIPTTTVGNFSQPVAYENSKGEQFLIGHNGRTNKFFNAETGEMMDTLPPDLKLAAKPRQFSRRFFVDDNGAVTSVNPNVPQEQQAQGVGVAPVPGARGKQFHQPAVTMRYDTPAGPVDVPTPRNEAYSQGKKALREAMGTAGGQPTANVLAPLTPTGQKALSDLMPTKALFTKLKASLEDIKNDNTPLENFPERLAYTGGLATEASKLISQLELAKITGAMPFAKASRNMQWLSQVQEHLGKVRTDSPKLLYSKITNALENFDEMEKDIRIYHVKGARPNAGLTPPPTAGAAKGNVRKYNPATGKLE